MYCGLLCQSCICTMPAIHRHAVVQVCCARSHVVCYWLCVQAYSKSFCRHWCPWLVSCFPDSCLLHFDGVAECPDSWERSVSVHLVHGWHIGNRVHLRRTSAICVCNCLNIHTTPVTRLADLHTAAYCRDVLQQPPLQNALVANAYVQP